MTTNNLATSSELCNRATGESISHWSHQSRKIRLIRFSSQDSFVRQCGVVRASAFLLRTAKLRDMDTFSIRNSGQNSKYVTEDMIIQSDVRRFLSMHLLENSSVRESNPTQPHKSTTSVATPRHPSNKHHHRSSSPTLHRPLFL
jgi:hypothetical protein